MKKTYLNPFVEIFSVMASSTLCVSEGDKFDGDSGYGAPRHDRSL